MQVYQEELTAQNETLTQSQAALEEVRDHLAELYDFAPTPYLTLNTNGIIQQINLTGATFLGKSSAALEGLPLSGFVEREHRRAYIEFLRHCRQATRVSDVSTHLTLRTVDGPRPVRLIGRVLSIRRSIARVLFVAIVDMTEQTRFEAERERAAAAYASLATRLLTVQDDERQRIARDLHDSIGQQVAALVAMAERVAVKGEPEMAQLTRALRQLDQRIDFLVNELRPPVLDRGLVPAIEQLGHDWSKVFGIPVEFRQHGNLGAVGDVPTHAYRIVQEALHNAQKHAHATRVSITLEQHDGFVIKVSDNGAGFVADSHSTGLGLVSMRERARLAGGELTIDSVVGRGTTVELRVSESLRGAGA